MINRFLSTRLGKFSQIFFAVYVAIWSFAEPMNIGWITTHLTAWRIGLFTAALLIAILWIIDLAGSSLEAIDASTTGKTLMDYSTHGSPTCRIVADGRIGQVMTILGDYSTDELDWEIKSSAQRAGKLILRFKHKKLFYFYLRVVVKSQSGDTLLPKWIRFDHTLVTPDVYSADKDEMGCAYQDDTVDKDGFLTATIDIKKYVQKTYGQGGWEYVRLMIFRIRTYDGAVKSIVFKK